MKQIRTVDAVGHILCHDITQIVLGVTKDARFRKGHVITEEDIPVLLSLGKDHIYVWENDASKMHEDEAAAVLRDLCQNEYMEASKPKEGKIELKTTIDGVFYVNEERLNALDDLEDISIATLPQHFPVKEGTKLAGMRVIPLVIDRTKMDEAKQVAGSEPLLRVAPYKKWKVGVVTTGTEVFLGRIKDTFTPVLDAKLHKFGLQVDEHRFSDDVKEHIEAAIQELLDAGMDLILCTGGMSVDPDDMTPAAIKGVGAKMETYGAPVLPGAMFLLSYWEKDGRTVPILGLPGCVMFAPATVFDLFLPRLIAGEHLTRRDVRSRGVGGLCMNCKVCHYPRCAFGRS